MVKQKQWCVLKKAAKGSNAQPQILSISNQSNHMETTAEANYSLTEVGVEAAVTLRYKPVIGPQ